MPMTADDLRAWRARHRITQEELAGKLNLSRYAIIDMELDRLPISREIERRIRECADDTDSEAA